MDKIYIKDLEIYAYHGVNQEEKNMGQRFSISVELLLNLSEAGKKDDLSKTVNYAQLCYDIEKEFTKYKYDLIEKCAEELAKFILITYEKVEKVKILIKKPWAPIGRVLDYVAVEIERQWHKVYIALGSNIGDKEENFKKALKMLSNEEIRIIKSSEFYVTKPVGYMEQDDFLNGVIEVNTLLQPKELMSCLLKIEDMLGRERIIRWGPRIIDLDIILFDNIISYDKEIIIPHPRMHERLFVLKPLSEIAPYVVHPILNKRIIQLVEEVIKNN